MSRRGDGFGRAATLRGEAPQDMLGVSGTSTVLSLSLSNFDSITSTRSRSSSFPNLGSFTGVTVDVGDVDMSDATAARSSSIRGGGGGGDGDGDGGRGGRGGRGRGLGRGRGESGDRRQLLQRSSNSRHMVEVETEGGGRPGLGLGGGDGGYHSASRIASEDQPPAPGSIRAMRYRNLDTLAAAAAAVAGGDGSSSGIRSNVSSWRKSTQYTNEEEQFDSWRSESSSIMALDLHLDPPTVRHRQQHHPYEQERHHHHP